MWKQTAVDYTSIWLQRLRKRETSINQNGRCPGRNLNRAPPACESIALSLRQPAQCSAPISVLRKWPLRCGCRLGCSSLVIAWLWLNVGQGTRHLGYPSEVTSAGFIIRWSLKQNCICLERHSEGKRRELWKLHLQILCVYERVEWDKVRLTLISSLDCSSCFWERRPCERIVAS
jgi:hypothetical protein